MNRRTCCRVERLATICGRFKYFLDGKSTSDCRVVCYVIGSSWKASSRLDSQKIPPVLWNMKIHYRVSKSLTLAPLLNHVNPFHTLTPNFFTIRCNATIKATSLVCLSGFRQRHTKLCTVLYSGVYAYRYVRMRIIYIPIDDSSQLGYDIV
jgi:hypothetical protein